MEKTTPIVILLVIVFGNWCANAEDAPNASTAEKMKPLQEGWQETDARQIFLITQLASVESSLDAIDKALARAGYRQAAKKSDSERFRSGNELMDRKGGGPVPWDEFYGRTADKFAYQRRPPQFDYIYRANDDRRRQAEKEASVLGDKIEALLDRRRQLESEQSAVWAKVAFRVVSSRNLAGRSLYRFELSSNASEVEHLEAVRAACEFVRTANQSISKIQDMLDTEQGKAYDELHRMTAAAHSDLDARLVRQPHLALDVEDTKTPIGNLVAAAKRLVDVSKNIEEALRLAGDGDKANDDQRKNTFRSALQDMLINYAETLLTTDQCVINLAKEWGIAPNPNSPIVFVPEQKDSGIKLNARQIPNNTSSTVTRMERPSKVGDTITNSIGMKLAFLPAGEFLIGSPVRESGREKDETQCRIRLTKSILMQTTEVTQSQWYTVMGDNPSHFKGDDLPVEQLSWDEAMAFCRRLSQKDGHEYRLPTEAEWEYACRAGTTTEYHGGNGVTALQRVGWCSYDNKWGSAKSTKRVGSVQANDWGLFDMHGNVQEWCSDWYGDYPNGEATDPKGIGIGQERIVRGGSWDDIPRYCRAAYRFRIKPTHRNSHIGFRVVCPVVGAGE